MSKDPSASTLKPKPTGKKVLTTIAIIIVVIVALVGTYELIKPWRAQQLADEALDLLKKDDLGQAREKVMAAKDLAPHSLNVARAVAKVWGRIAPNQVAPLWEYAAELSGNAKEDEQNLALALIASGEPEQAHEILQKLLETAGSDPKTTFVEINWLISASRREEALTKILPLIAQYPDKEEYWKVYSFIVKEQREGLPEYISNLQKVSGNPTNLGLWACEELSRLASAKDLEARLSMTLHHPLATRNTVMMAYALRHQKAGLPFADIHKVLDREFNMALATDRHELASFYRSLGDNEGAIALINGPQAASNHDDLMIYLDALAGAHKWQALLEVLSLDKLPLENYWREIFRARAYANMGKTGESELAWRHALEDAGTKAAALTDIAYYVVALGAETQVDEVMPLLIENSGPNERAVHYQIWLRFALAKHETARVQSILEKMTAEYPKNSAVKNDYIYYSLLVKKPGNWVKEADQLVHDAPGVLAHRVTLTLALLRVGENANAYTAINSIRITEWDQMPIGWQMVRAAAYKKNNKLMPAINNPQLALAEERALLK